LLPTGVTDAAGNAMLVGTSLSFFNLTGDANHDGTVGFDDLLTLAQNYGQSSRTYADGDFDHDGTVSFTDLLLLAQQYGKTLDPAPALVAAISSRPLRAALPRSL